MALFPEVNAKLICPKCGGAVTTIHPFYTATEKSFDLQFINQWWLYPLAGFVGIIWWPLGLVAVIAVFFRDIIKAKKSKLYCCKTCNLKLSYVEAKTVEKNAT